MVSHPALRGLALVQVLWIILWQDGSYILKEMIGVVRKSLPAIEDACQSAAVMPMISLLNAAHMSANAPREVLPAGTSSLAMEVTPPSPASTGSARLKQTHEISSARSHVPAEMKSCKMAKRITMSPAKARLVSLLDPHPVSCMALHEISPSELSPTKHAAPAGATGESQLGHTWFF